MTQPAGHIILLGCVDVVVVDGGTDASFFFPSFIPLAGFADSSTLSDTSMPINNTEL